MEDEELVTRRTSPESSIDRLSDEDFQTQFDQGQLMQGGEDIDLGVVKTDTSKGSLRDNVQGMQQMLAERAASSGIQPIDRSNETISMPTENKSAIEQIGTLLSNPFSGTRALVNQTRGGIRNSLGMSDQGDREGVYGSLTSLARAKDSNDLETQKALESGNEFNSASQIAALASGAALTGQTVADLLQGDPTAMALKTAKKYKPIYNTAKKAYMGLKGGKVAKNIL
tara:strand:+ start:26 stop:706 length:681 start_codon:yes stop_codon:yes gene_type:complete